MDCAHTQVSLQLGATANHVASLFASFVVEGLLACVGAELGLGLSVVLAVVQYFKPGLWYEAWLAPLFGVSLVILLGISLVSKKYW